MQSSHLQRIFVVVMVVVVVVVGKCVSPGNFIFIIRLEYQQSKLYKRRLENVS